MGLQGDTEAAAPVFATHFQLKGASAGLILAKNQMAGIVMTPTAIKNGTKWLASADVRPTRQRVALASLLVGDGMDRHVTAESLFDDARGVGESVSLATVYNTLRAFCDAGLMQEITVDGSKSYFDTNISDHPHFFWEDDRVLTDAPAEQLKIVQLPEAPAGAEISKVDVVVRLRRK